MFSIVRLYQLAANTPCDPIWQVTLRSSVMDFLLTAIYHLYLFLLSQHRL